MFNIKNTFRKLKRISKFNMLTILLAVITTVYTFPTISGVVIKSTTEKQVSSDFNKQIECLAKNIYHEAGHEPYEGKLAVAQVTMNRVNSGKFPSDVCSVVYQKTTNKHLETVCQFSWTCMVKELVVRDKYAYEESMNIARKALTQPVLHDTIANTNALFYHAVYVNPGWNKGKVVKRIGNHIFYTSI